MAHRRAPKLTDAELGDALAGLDGWTLQDQKLHRLYEFRDFEDAFGFMASCAVIAAAMDHHPEWLNVYRRVEVWLWTHDSGGVTAKDTALARAMDERARR